MSSGPRFLRLPGSAESGDTAVAPAETDVERRLARIDRRWVKGIVWLFRPLLRWYYRVEIADAQKFAHETGPIIFVANHNAGYVLDILVMLLATEPWAHPERHLIGMGRGGPVDAPVLKEIIEKIGCIPDTVANAREALRRNCWVLMCPGGVRGVIRPIWKRNEVRFDWQRSYVRLAQSERCPIYPVAISGSHETVPVLWTSRRLWKLVPGVRAVVPGAGEFPITFDHALNLAVFLLLPIRHGLIAWAIFVLLNLYVDAVFFWPWLPAKIRVQFGDPIYVESAGAADADRRAVTAGHRRVVDAIERMLATIHAARPWPKFLV